MQSKNPMFRGGNTQNVVTLEELAHKHWPRPKGTVMHTGVALDTETTGTGPKDVVIEIGLIEYEVYTCGAVVRVGTPYTALQDPGFPIPAESTRVHGITDEMVVGKSIDWNHVAGIIDHAGFVVAWNAEFDYRMVPRSVHEKASRAVWGCAMRDEHRAGADCKLMLAILAISGQMLRVHEVGSQPTVVVRSFPPFSMKDEVKARRYRWDPNGRLWWCSCTIAEADVERKWLTERHVQHQLVEVNPVDRWSRA